jgi:hypothetical protein
MTEETQVMVLKAPIAEKLSNNCALRLGKHRSLPVGRNRCDSFRQMREPSEDGLHTSSLFQIQRHWRHDETGGPRNIARLTKPIQLLFLKGTQLAFLISVAQMGDEA